MGTRSRIGVMHGDVCKSVYCHWDGYLEHNGRILQEYYNSSRANELVALGDISSLGELIGEKHPFSPHTSAEDKIAHEAAAAAGWTTFYNRDRGETGVEFATDFSFESFLNRVEGTGAEYYYIMRDGVWYTGCPGKGSRLVPLSEALVTPETENA